MESLKEFNARAELKVGEEVFLLNRRLKKGTLEKISRVGRKYFYIDDTAFYILDKGEVTIYQSNYDLYPSEESFKVEREKSESYGAIKRLINLDYSNAIKESLTKDELKQILTLITKVENYENT